MSRSDQPHDGRPVPIPVDRRHATRPTGRAVQCRRDQASARLPRRGDGAGRKVAGIVVRDCCARCCGRSESRGSFREGPDCLAGEVQHAGTYDVEPIAQPRFAGRGAVDCRRPHRVVGPGDSLQVGGCRGERRLTRRRQSFVPQRGWRGGCRWRWLPLGRGRPDPGSCP